MLGMLALACVGLVVAPASAQEPSVSVRLSPEQVGLGEAVSLEIVLEGADPNVHFDASFEVDNLRVRRGPMTSTSLQITNGVASTTRALRWRLVPLEVGTARVTEVVVQIGDQERRLEGGQIEVLTEPPPRRRRQADPFSPFDSDPFNRRRRQPEPQREPKIFLRAEVVPANPYVGQQATYTLYLYTQANIQGVNPESIPDFNGFWVRELPQPDESEPDMVEWQGESFGRVVLLQRALFPRRAGEVTIEPVRASLVAQVGSRGFSLLARSVSVDRESNAVTLDVRPLGDAPPGFSGAVGDLDLEATLDPAALSVGDAATLTLTLSGRGNLQGLTAPTLPELPGIEVFPPQQQSDESIRGKTIHGTRVWRYVLVPSRTGDWTLPTIEVPYFDPRQGSFEAASVEGLTLAARGATRATQAEGVEVTLRPIRSAALPVAEPLRLQPYLRWLFALPWLAMVGLLVVRRRSGAGHGPAKRALLAALGEAADQERPRQAAAAIEDGWRAFLEDRYGLPRGTASPQWAEELESRGVARGVAEDLATLADDLHYLRYAPKLSSTTDLRDELIERSRRLLDRCR
ncbi:MAG: BatD family protein [Acidobacteriota bacterium]